MYNNCFGQKNRAGLNILAIPDALLWHNLLATMQKTKNEKRENALSPILHNGISPEPSK